MITKDDVLNDDYDFYAVIALIDKIAELEKELEPHRRTKVTVISLELAAQCWCDEDTSSIEMDSHLANAFAKRLDTKDKRIAELEKELDPHRRAESIELALDSLLGINDHTMDN
jgi:hypothetical protein